MLRWNGSVVGKANLANAGKPSGLYSLPSQGSYASQNRWPVTLPVTANLILHIDASNAASVTLNSGSVSAITDLSPSGLTVNQTTAARQPNYVTNYRNGLNVIRFHRSNSHFLDVTSTTIPASHTVIMAAQRAAPQTDLIGLATYTTNRYSFIWDTSNNVYQSSNASFTAHSSNTTTGWFHLTTVREGTTKIRLRINGTNSDVTTGTGVTNAVDGSWNAIGRRASANYSSYDLGEMLVYDTNLSDADVSAVEAYLASKWAI